MNINLEASNQHAVQSYSNTEIRINSIVYTSSLIVSKNELITNLNIKSISQIDEDFINLLISLKPEVIILGHTQSQYWLPGSVQVQLAQQGIGIECMMIGPACRTYNVLLSEHRAVVAGFIY